MLNQLKSMANTPLLKATVVLIILVVVLQSILSFKNLFLHLPSEADRYNARLVAKDILEDEGARMNRDAFIQFVRKLDQSHISVGGHQIHYTFNTENRCDSQMAPNTLIKLKRQSCSYYRYSDDLVVNIYTELPRVISTAVTLPMMITLGILIIIIFYVFYLIRMFYFNVQFSRYLARFGMNMEIKPSSIKEDPLTRQIRKVILRSIERIGKAQQSRAKILANTLHDLRAPLHRIKLRMQLRQEQLDAKDERDFDEIELITSTLLVYGKDDWLYNEVFQQVDIKALTEQVYTDYYSLDYKITLEKLPNRQAIIHGKPNAIKRAITNIINNAYQHGDQVRLALHSNASHWSIHIIDNGPGIPEEKIHSVFDAYVSLKNTTGIGLTIAREIIEYHQGEISLTNTDGGLDVEIKFPR